MPTLTIIETGLVPAPLRVVHGSYPDMFARALSPYRADLTFETIAASAASYPALDTLDAVLLTGSSAGVYENHPWIAPLSTFVRSVHAAGIPLVGVCFGHQLIAQALGGVVRKSERGWGIGRHVYAVAPGNGILEGDSLAVACSHQDQVIEPPAGTATILSSPFTPHAGLLYVGGTTLTVQPHPEFTPGYAWACCEARAGQASDAVVTTAKASLREPLNGSAILNRAFVRLLTSRELIERAAVRT